MIEVERVAPNGTNLALANLSYTWSDVAPSSLWERIVGGASSVHAGGGRLVHADGRPASLVVARGDHAGTLEAGDRFGLPQPVTLFALVDETGTVTATLARFAPHCD